MGVSLMGVMLRLEISAKKFLQKTVFRKNWENQFFHFKVCYKLLYMFLRSSIKMLQWCCVWKFLSCGKIDSRRKKSENTICQNLP